MDMNEDRGPKGDSASRRLPGQVVLVLQGGGALGAYQGGVYEALHEAGIEPDWVIGTSIGAVNGALIAGNTVKQRLERLRTFWSRVEAEEPPSWKLLPEQLGKLSSSLMVLMSGVRGFFAPNLALALGPQTPVGVERAALYSIAPLKATLADLVDFSPGAFKRPRFTLGLVNVTTGEFRYFDSRDEELTLDHLIASTAVPPAFPAIPIDGHMYWDGGIYSNTPIEAVFDDNPRRNSVIFAVQLWQDRGELPASLMQVLSREKDITFTSRTKSHVARQAQLHRLRHVVRELVHRLPEEERNSPEVKELADYGCATFMHLVEINAPHLAGDGFSRDFDFSHDTIQTRWQAGLADTRRVLARRPWESNVDPVDGVAVYTCDDGMAGNVA